MRVAIAKKIAHENGMSLEYDNGMRLYILKDKEQGWPDQFFPGSALRTMANDVFMQFFLRIKDYVSGTTVCRFAPAKKTK